MLKRCDDLDRKTAISNARKAIYEKNRGVASAAVSRELDAESLTPASVRFHYLCNIELLLAIANTTL
jgi:hypothetical protein